MTRLTGWEADLNNRINIELAKPFDWKTSNCAHLMAASVIACVGPDHPSLIELSQYTSEEVIKGIISHAGGIGPILSRYFSQLGSVLQAQRGDLIVVKGPLEEAGCVMMDGAIVGKMEEPNKRGEYSYRLPRSQGSMAFRVE